MLEKLDQKHFFDKSAFSDGALVLQITNGLDSWSWPMALSLADGPDVMS